MAQEDQEYQLTEKGKELSEKIAQNNIEKDELQSKIIDPENKLTSEKLKADLKELDKKIAEAKQLEKEKQKETKRKTKAKKEPATNIPNDNEESEENDAGTNKGRMGYREAQGIRKKSFGALLGEQEGGLGTSLKKAMSLKSKAKMTGIREAFDPMNIAKKLTFGSNLAPAIVGKMFGRKQEDIAHFTGGKVRSADTSSKLKPIDKEPGAKDGMVDILTKILTLLQKTNDSEIKSKEKQHNYDEENEIEKEKKRKELLFALQNKENGGDKSAEKIESGTGLGLGGIIESILGSFGGLTSGLSVLSSIGGFFLGPIGLALLGGTLTMAMLFRDKHAEETNKGLQNAGNPDTAMATSIVESAENTDAVEKRKMKILSERPFSKKSLIPWKDPDLQKDYLKEIGFDEKTGLTSAEKQQGYTGLDEEGMPTKKESATPTTKSAEPSATPASDSAATASATPASDSSTTTSASLSSNESVVPTAAPVESTNVGQKLNQTVAENNTAKIESAVAEASTSTVNNSTNVQSQKNEQERKPILAVRNTEDTFRRMIMKSTRVV